MKLDVANDYSWESIHFMIVVSKYLVLSKPLTWKLLYNSSYTKDYYKMNAFQHHFSADKIQLNFQASLLYIYVSDVGTYKFHRSANNRKVHKLGIFWEIVSHLI